MKIIEDILIKYKILLLENSSDAEIYNKLESSEIPDEYDAIKQSFSVEGEFTLGGLFHDIIIYSPREFDLYLNGLVVPMDRVDCCLPLFIIKKNNLVLSGKGTINILTLSLKKRAKLYLRNFTNLQSMFFRNARIEF